MFESILAHIDNEIARLHKAKIILSKFDAPVQRMPGRPSKAAATVAQLPVKLKRTLSPEAREKIRQGQMKRWAVTKRAFGTTGQRAKKTRTATKATS